MFCILFFSKKNQLNFCLELNLFPNSFDFGCGTGSIKVADDDDDGSPPPFISHPW
jgi:hypothetical protein